MNPLSPKFEETAPALTILYKAGEGGSVTVGQESFSAADLTNGAVPAGAEAVSAEGFQFVNWTAADESIVSEGAVFVPSVTADMSGEVVYTANHRCGCRRCFLRRCGSGCR